MKSPSKIAFEAILIAAVLLALVAIPRAASAASHGGHKPPPFAEFDADGDGFISENEFNSKRAEHMAARAAEGRPMRGAANAPSFAELDEDGDGRLSEDELRAGQQEHMAAMRKSKGSCGGEGRGMPTFVDIDADGDGCISAEEFAGHQAEHHGRCHQGNKH